jgi:hypothetical protein
MISLNCSRSSKPQFKVMMRCAVFLLVPTFRSILDVLLVSTLILIPLDHLLNYTILLPSALLKIPVMPMKLMPASLLSSVILTLVNARVVVDALDYLLSPASMLLAQGLILPMSAAFAELLIQSLAVGTFLVSQKDFSRPSTTSKSCHKPKKVPGLLVRTVLGMDPLALLLVMLLVSILPQTLIALRLISRRTLRTLLKTRLKL